MDSRASYLTPVVIEAERSPDPQPRSAATRILHLALLLAVVYQLVGSEFVERPLPGDPPGTMLLLHQYVGMATMLLVLGFWLWTIVRRGETRLAAFLPWFSPARMRLVLADLRLQAARLLKGSAPDDRCGALASAIHGAGLLAVTAMAASGTLWFFLEGQHVARLALAVHKAIANAVWAYLVVHASVAVLHHLHGSDIFSRMFGRGGRA